jgi:hypothetical protein
MTGENDIKELGEYWRFQSSQMWSRIQTTSFVEAGVLTGWYTVYKEKAFFLGTMILLIGAVILIVIALLMLRDSQYMKACEKRIGNNFPRPDEPFLKISGRIIAVGLPILLAVSDIILVFVQRII